MTTIVVARMIVLLARIVLSFIVAVGLFWVVSTRGIDQDRGEEARYTCIECPAGTGDVRAISEVVDSRLALVLREENTGKFGAWLLDLRTPEFSRLSDLSFRVPVAVGLAPDGKILVLEAVRGGTRANLLDRAGLVRQWPLSGVLPRMVHYHESGDDGAGYELHPVVTDPGGYIVTNSVIPNLRFYDHALQPTDRAWELVRWIPTYRSPADAGEPPLDRPPAANQEWLNSWDCPDHVSRLGDRLVVLVRRPDHRGHLLLVIDRQGTRKGMASLPRTLGPPMATHEGMIVLTVEGESGSPARLVTGRPDAFLRKASDRVRFCRAVTRHTDLEISHVTEPESSCIRTCSSSMRVPARAT